jgi:co-chaperonin GroES (HSP10)
MGNKETKTINYKPLGTTLLIKLKMETESGIILAGGTDTPLDVEVVAIGPDVTKVKVGDKIMAVGNSYALSVDEDEYFQIYESSIMGIVQNGAKVMAISKGSTTREY